MGNNKTTLLSAEVRHLNITQCDFVNLIVENNRVDAHVGARLFKICGWTLASHHSYPDILL